ncbi:MAG: hypothetical protein OXE78_00450 [Gammaproteobacteria bacterium]|nr:hypothetical protein [Gammaproteobacteria bacterium]
MQRGRIAVDEFTSLIVALPRELNGGFINLLHRIVAAEIVQHKLIQASTILSIATGY